MTDVLIKRELLERLACEVIPKTHQEMLDASEDFGAAIKELRAILAAPRQPEGDWGWLVNLELAEVQCNCPWNPDSHDPSCPVYLRDRLSDAQRAITELREECERLREQLAERDAEIEEWSGTAVHNGMECDRLAAQRDKLAGLLQRAFDSEERHDVVWGEIYAALAEVKP